MLNKRTLTLGLSVVRDWEILVNFCIAFVLSSVSGLKTAATQISSEEDKATSQCWARVVYSSRDLIAPTSSTLEAREARVRTRLGSWPDCGHAAFLEPRNASCQYDWSQSAVWPPSGPQQVEFSNLHFDIDNILRRHLWAPFPCCKHLALSHYNNKIVRGGFYDIVRLTSFLNPLYFDH